MPYEEVESEEVEEEAPTGGEGKEYSPDEMLEYLLNEVTSVDEARALLSEHGFELKKSGGQEDFAEEESLEVEESPEGEMEEGMSMPMPMPMPMPSRPPRVNISVLRLDAAKKALGKDKKKKSKEA